MRSVVRENVAEHSYHVAILAHALASISNRVFKKSVPMDEVVSLALLHDATEVFTGDIPTPVKHHNAAILANFREIEHIAAARLVSMVPDPLRDDYEKLLLKNEQVSTEAIRLVKAADLLDAYLKCESELSAGNREFARAKEETRRNLMALDMPEVVYFLRELAPAFASSLDELEQNDPQNDSQTH